MCWEVYRSYVGYTIAKGSGHIKSIVVSKNHVTIATYKLPYIYIG